MRAARFKASNGNDIVYGGGVCIVGSDDGVYMAIAGIVLHAPSVELDLTIDEAAAELDAALRDERSIDA